MESKDHPVKTCPTLRVQNLLNTLNYFHWLLNTFQRILLSILFDRPTIIMQCRITDKLIFVQIFFLMTLVFNVKFMAGKYFFVEKVST